ncbi:MAG: hypothetical protein LBO69_09875 [Ignavibacteria bacterium]|jgi:hypothetical protein|nr:hypothetical protein [Ignavibacteria bacterium]
MLNEICANIFENKWNEFLQQTFPINAQKIAAIDCLDDFLRQFFFAEIHYYCNNILLSLSENTNLSPGLLHNEDAEQVKQILFDWVVFDEESAKQILTFAIQTEINFFFNPTKALTVIAFGDTDECEIPIIIERLAFFTDMHSIVKGLTEELLELNNSKQSMSKLEFMDLASDLIFKISQEQSINDFLLPIAKLMAVASMEMLPIGAIETFFAERDLSGILSHIVDYANENAKDGLTFEELSGIISELFDKPEGVAEEPSEMQSPEDVSEIIEDSEIAEIVEEEVPTVEESPIEWKSAVEEEVVEVREEIQINEAEVIVDGMSESEIDDAQCLEALSEDVPEIVEESEIVPIEDVVVDFEVPEINDAADGVAEDDVIDEPTEEEPVSFEIEVAVDDALVEVSIEPVPSAQEINAKITGRINTMRSGGNTPVEIAKEYQIIEGIFIDKLKTKMKL